MNRPALVAFLSAAVATGSRVWAQSSAPLVPPDEPADDAPADDASADEAAPQPEVSAPATAPPAEIAPVEQTPAPPPPPRRRPSFGAAHQIAIEDDLQLALTRSSYDAGTATISSNNLRLTPAVDYFGRAHLSAGVGLRVDYHWGTATQASGVLGALVRVGYDFAFSSSSLVSICPGLRSATASSEIPARRALCPSGSTSISRCWRRPFFNLRRASSSASGRRSRPTCGRGKATPAFPILRSSVSARWSADTSGGR